MNFREAPGTLVEWIDTAPNAFSNFDYIEKAFGTGNPVLRRIFSFARKLKFRSLLVEQIEEKDCALLAEENAVYAIRRPSFTHSNVIRFSFFRCPANFKEPANEFIGYAVVKIDHATTGQPASLHVYEAVLPQARSSTENNFVHCDQQYTVSTAIGKFSVRGVLYAQQNDWTFVCAHVAIRSAISCFGIDLSYSEINAAAGIDHDKNRIGEGVGLELDFLEPFLQSKGIYTGRVANWPGILNYTGEYQKDLYGYIESGGPALLGFETENPVAAGGNALHLIPVFGHTFNEDTWVPDADRSYFSKVGKFHSSDAWVSAFVAHDDNFGPYYCLPRHFLTKAKFRDLVGLEQYKTELKSVDIEPLAFAYIRQLLQINPIKHAPWYHRLGAYVTSGWAVLRPMVVTREAYLVHVTDLDCRNNQVVEPELVDSLRQLLPPYFWMVEVTAPELFSSTRRKFGELLISATQPMPKDLSLLLAARLPGVLLMQTAGRLNATTSAFVGHSKLFSLS